MSECPRIMIAAPSSGAGKTTITIAILKALANRGLSPVAFKCGPDYIDPMFHREALGLPSYNLDLFLTNKKTVRALLHEHSKHHGAAVIEGVMGYYDGIGATSRSSSYELARATGTPVVLVVSAKGASMSIAAQISGFAKFRKHSMIAGVILNDCSVALYTMLRDAIEKETGIKLLGYFPTLKDCSLESRHLGLVTAQEISNISSMIERLGIQAEESVDMNALLGVAHTARETGESLPKIKTPVLTGPRIAVARDKAFCFYYADNLELLERLGAELVPFSPLNGSALPDGIDALYLGGGYPELYASQLSENTPMLDSVRRAIEGGLPTLAECGGFLYLHESLEDDTGTAFPLVGVLKGRGFKTRHLQHFGYITLTARRDTVLCAEGGAIPAHEFHYWDTTVFGSACQATKSYGTGEWSCISTDYSLFAGFPHLYFYGNPDFARGFVKAAAAFQSERTQKAK